jgi:ribosomal protein S18 acetylase RimI-like enzyme
MIRRLEPHEVALHRSVRLRALDDAPDSFGDRFDDISARPPAYWDELTRSVTDPQRHVMFLACSGTAVCGAVYGLVDDHHPDAGRVGGMWVAPESRCRGLGAALLDAVIGWARARGFTRLELSAPSHSPAALALYRRAGFSATGARWRMPGRPHIELVAMARAL